MGGPLFASSASPFYTPHPILTCLPASIIQPPHAGEVDAPGRLYTRAISPNMYSPYSVHGNPALASGSNTTSNPGHGESSSHSASPIQHPSRTTTHLTPHSTYNQHSHSSSDFGGLPSSGPSYNLSSPTHGFDYTLPTFTDSPWSFASGSTIPPPNHTHHGSSTSAYDSQPNSAGLPVPAPLPFESQLRDQALALHQHWGSFAPVTNTNSNPLFANPLQHQMHALQLQQQQHHHHHHHHHQHHQPQLHPSTSTSIPPATNWNLATETPSSFFEALTQMFPNHMDGGSTPLSENGRMTFSDYFPPAGLMDYTEPVNMSLQDNTGVSTPPLASGAAGNGKGKEKADGMGDYFDGLYGVNGMNDIKRSKAEEFDKDVALVSDAKFIKRVQANGQLQTYLTDLVGLLEPFGKAFDDYDHVLLANPQPHRLPNPARPNLPRSYTPASSVSPRQSTKLSFNSVLQPTHSSRPRFQALNRYRNHPPPPPPHEGNPRRRHHPKLVPFRSTQRKRWN